MTALVLILLMTAQHPAASPAGDGPRPAPGVLLVAGTQIQDPRFAESVILLLSAGTGGAMGLIINKPSATKVSSRFSGIGSRGHGGDPLFFGGPVGGHEVLMLRRSDRAPDDWAAVVDRVFVTNNRSAMMDVLLAGRTDEEVRVYAGYAGWGPGQLEREIARGDWYLVPAEASHIFRRDMTKLWPELSRKSREIVL